MLYYAVLAILLLQTAYNSPSNRFEASNQCLKDGGRLASIHNAFTNALILDLAALFGPNTVLWIGLICADANAKNCVWDDGQVGADQYNAFYPGFPLVNSDAYWFFTKNSNSGDIAGKWASNLYNVTYGYVCEVTTRDSADIMDLARNSHQH